MSALTNLDREQLARQYIWLAKSLALRACLSWEDRDEIISDAMLGLTHAARCFDPRRCPTFKAYAWSRITNSIRDGRRTREPLTRGRRRQILNGAERHPHEQPVVRLDHRDDRGGYSLDTDQVHQRLDLHAALQHLTQQERQVIILHHLEDMTQAAVAQLLGVTESRISQIAATARAKLAEHLG